MSPVQIAFTDLLHTKRLQTLQSVDDAIEKVRSILLQFSALRDGCRMLVREFEDRFPVVHTQHMQRKKNKILCTQRKQHTTRKRNRTQEVANDMAVICHMIHCISVA